jgi:hypothetical protein
MVICGKCGHENPDGRQFCEACDEYLVWRGKSTSATMASLAPTEVSVTPGGDAGAKLRVFNRGAIVDKFSFELPAELAEWVTVEPAALNLYPNTNAEAAIHFRPPRSPAVQAGEVPFTVKVRSDVNPDTTTEATATVTVEPFLELAGRLVPNTSRSTGTAEHQIKIGNGGNAPADVSISVTNPDDLLVFQLESDKVTLAPGAGASLKLQVTPRDPDQMAQGVAQSFRLTLTASGAPDMTLDGAYMRVTLVELDAKLDPETSSSAGTAEHWVTLTNKGNAPAPVTLSASDPGQLLTFQLTPSNLTLDAGGSTRVRLWVGLRQQAERPEGTGQPRGTPLPFQVLARAGDTTPVELNGTYTPLFVEMTATLEPRTSRASGQAHHALTVVNHGNRQAAVAIATADADDVLKLSVIPASLIVGPGESAGATVWVSLREPWSPEGGKARPFEVQLTTDGSAPVKVAGGYVPLFAEVGGTLDPPTSEGIGTGEQWVVVQNTGNLHVDAALSATDPGRAFDFELAPTWVALEPGETARVRLRMSPRRHPREPQPLPFQVQITSQTAPAVTVQGTRVQVPPPRQPRRWPPILIRVLLAVACLVIGALVALSVAGMHPITSATIIPGQPINLSWVPFVSLAALALGVLGFIIFIPRRGWFIAVGLLAAGAVGVAVLSGMKMSNL